VVGFVENEQRAGIGAWSLLACLVGAEEVSKRCRIILVPKECMRQNEARMCGPGVDGIAAFSFTLGHKVTIIDLKGEPESLLEFLLPLCDGRWRRHNDHPANPLTHQHFTQDQTCFNGLSKTNVVRNEEIDPWQTERFPEGLKLVCHHLDASTPGRLKKSGVCRRYTVPSQRMQVGGKP